jgi:hypothetical protein
MSVIAMFRQLGTRIVQSGIGLLLFLVAEPIFGRARKMGLRGSRKLAYGVRMYPCTAFEVSA